MVAELRSVSTSSTATLADFDTLFGLPLGGSINFADQYNAPKAITVSNSNLADFSDVGFTAHPGYGAIVDAVNYVSSPNPTRDGGYFGEPTHDYFVNDTFMNMPTAVQILSGNANDPTGPVNMGAYVTPAEAVFLNDTFYNDTNASDANSVVGGTAIHTFAPVFNGQNSLSHVAVLAMDSIFDGFGTAVVTDGQNYGGLQNEGGNNTLRILPSQLQYDDFFNVTNEVGGTGSGGGGGGVAQVSVPYTSDPGLRNPNVGNFFLLPTSKVIDVARSEIGPTIFGDMLYPADNVVPGSLSAVPIRNEPTFVGGVLDQTQPAGDINIDGGLGYIGGGPTGAPYYVDIVTLPGRIYPTSSGGAAQINYPDQWVAVQQASGLGTSGAYIGSPQSLAYEPITGQRDQVGNLRVPDPNSINKGGFGSKPFFDLGAFEYIVQNPPVVEGVSATTTISTTNLYAVGSVAGVNQLPSSIQFLFNERLNPATLNGMSVILQASGGDGIFGNGNSPLDRSINLSGLLSFNNATDILTINTSGIFNSLATASDEYRIVLKGTGSAVIRDNSGLALDGTNLDAAGNQLPLPSGADNFPGSDFQVTFTIDTHAPAIVAGTFRLDPTDDKSGIGANITNIPLPTFDGTITDTFPPVNFLQNDTVIIDISSKGNGVFDILNAGVGTTNANGTFAVTLTKPIPNTPNVNGTNGIQQGPGSTITYARVRVIDQSGNQSNLATDPFSAFQADGALTGLQEDTVNPTVKAFSPTANTIITPSNGRVNFSVTFSENIKTSTINASSVLVYRTNGTGNFTNPVQVPIIANSFAYSFSTNPATLGQETVTFAVSSTQPNDMYEVVLKGTGATPITDLASNPLSGANNGQPGDFTSGPIIFFAPSNAHLIYVGPAGSGTGTAKAVLGTREAPFTTIAAGMAAALIGDDVLVLPGTYNEDVTLKPGVRLLSADPASTDTAFLAGTPYNTLIYGVVPTTGTTSQGGNGITTVYIAGGYTGIPTEISGFSIISPLLGDPNVGSIDSTDVAVRTLNTNASIDRNIIVNAGVGVLLATAGQNDPTATLYDNLIAGNIYGVEITDNGATSSIQQPFAVVNNTIVDNTTGLINIATASNATQAHVINNIFYSNHDLSSARNGTGIQSARADTLAVGNNLFYQNGPNNSAASNATGTFLGFNPALLSTTPDALGNLIGNPYFAQAQDPRPNADTPAVFFTYGNFDLTSRSVAINAADNALAPASDFLYRTPVAIKGHGFPGTGPASIGAFYFGGKSGASGGTGITYPGTTTCLGRERHALGDAAGLTQFGVNLQKLDPGSWSSQRHWHTAEDEFVWIVQGEVVLVTDTGEETLRAGDCAGFKAGDPDGHHLQNRSSEPAFLLEIGSRRGEEDEVDYPDIDLKYSDKRGETHKDGTPY